MRPDRSLIFFFQAEDGIRDYKVTGVQTCALPICPPPHSPAGERGSPAASELALGSAGAGIRVPGQPVACLAMATDPRTRGTCSLQIGRASCRERVYVCGGPVYVTSPDGDVRDVTA